MSWCQKQCAGKLLSATDQNVISSETLYTGVVDVEVNALIAVDLEVVQPARFTWTASL